MSRSADQLHFDTEHFVQKTAVALVCCVALAAVGVTVAAALGFLPWISLPIAWNGTLVPWAGMAAQIGLAVFAFLIALTMPISLRVLKLERTHRDFSISMSDVAEAYALCHAADRQGAFTLSREYDATRERIAYLRQHPNLADLEPEVLTAAAQMSAVSKDLAETYSDEALARARNFLEERQYEVERFRGRIDEVTESVNGLRRWLESVELDESICESQLRQLEDQMGETMEKVGLIRAKMAPPDRPVRLRRVAE